eukprot:CAMPEP_0178926756 /NCGR_PEP_ID=MMETSP0786-20121207/18733_1 /TAXON_ID=186022 /ORGANISM="Thalassionema frauenfeldii, Strain CCMP 1798" /LENGTH=860 /DNA_ID=CAMNT_0020601961 /DNA_START=195 /DNA_END=2777 /DNA_ORIENTATION=-
MILGICATFLVTYCSAIEQFPCRSLVNGDIVFRGGGFSSSDGNENGSQVLKQQNRRRFLNIFKLKSDDKIDEALAQAKIEKLPSGSGRGGALAVAKQSQINRLKLHNRIENKKPLLLITNTKVFADTNTAKVKNQPKSIFRLWWTSSLEEVTSNEPRAEEKPVSQTNKRTKEYMQSDTDDKKEKGKILKSQEESKENPSQLEKKTEGATDKVDKVETRKDDKEAETLPLELPEVLCEEKLSEQNNASATSAGAEKELRKEQQEVEDVQNEKDRKNPSILAGDTPHTSSGYWRSIDSIASLGMSNGNPQLRLSRQLRPIRKAAAKATGLSGVISGKQRTAAQTAVSDEEVKLGEADLGRIRRLTTIDRAHKLGQLKEEEKTAREGKKRRRFSRRRKRNDIILPANFKDGDNEEKPALETVDDAKLREKLQKELEVKRRHERVEEIDNMIVEWQRKLQELICEKDSLQRRPSPLYNYTASPSEDGDLTFSRNFNFPPDSLVDDYLDDIFATGRLVRMNHTHLWRTDDDDDDGESIGDDLLTPSGDARKLYGKDQYREERLKKSSSADDKKKSNGNGGGGSWLLRQSLGRRGSLGMKIGEIAEDNGYKAVCKGVMASLAQSIASLHGINVMTHSDIRLYVEQAPDLPPLRRNFLPEGDSYAEEAIKSAMMKGRKKRKKGHKMSQETFIQRDAVVETLLSHVQISAPLLKLFPLIWQRALLANMITLITQIVSDFCSGIELQILGHSLTLSFKPISESDLIRHIGLAGKGFNHRRTKPEKFEAAVKATAEDVAKNLQFLDRWHERALGSDMLRAQIANLIARLVLTLTDEVLSGARMDLWAAQAGGPRVVAGLEYRTPKQSAPP